MTPAPHSIHITIDCHDPEPLVAFWCLALGYRPKPPPEPKTVKNRVHIDIRLSEGRSVPVEQRAALVEAKAAELEAAGATRQRRLDETEGHYGVVMQDPEGNEFCLT